MGLALECPIAQHYLVTTSNAAVPTAQKTRGTTFLWAGTKTLFADFTHFNEFAAVRKPSLREALTGRGLNQTNSKPSSLYKLHDHAHVQMMRLSITMFFVGLLHLATATCGCTLRAFMPSGSGEER